MSIKNYHVPAFHDTATGAKGSSSWSRLPSSVDPREAGNGTTCATGRPRFVTITVRRPRSTSSNTERHFALNSPAAMVVDLDFMVTRIAFVTICCKWSLFGYSEQLPRTKNRFSVSPLVCSKGPCIAELATWPEISKFGREQQLRICQYTGDILIEEEQATLLVGSWCGRLQGKGHQMRTA